LLHLLDKIYCECYSNGCKHEVSVKKLFTLRYRKHISYTCCS